MIINELLELVVPFKDKYEARLIDEFAKKAGHEVLQTPPYHCELDPIELVGHIPKVCASL